MDQLGQVVQSRRCLGATTADVPNVISQASSLKVDELKMLHTKLLTGEHGTASFQVQSCLQFTPEPAGQI